MKLLPLVITGIVIIATPAFARIGETQDQCSMRYGSAKGSNGQFTIYYQNRLNIAVQYSNGVSIKEIFSPDAGATLQEDQIAELLGANSGGSTWTVRPGIVSLRIYGRADGGATARLDAGGLTIFSESVKIAPVKQPTSGL